MCFTAFLCFCVFSLLWLNLLFETWRRPRRLKLLYKQEVSGFGRGAGGYGGVSVLRKAPQGPAQFQHLFYPFMSSCSHCYSLDLPIAYLVNNWFFSWWRNKKVFAQDIPKCPLKKSAVPHNNRLNSNHTISALYLPMVANYIIVPKYPLPLPEGELYFLAWWIIALVTWVALAKEILSGVLSVIPQPTPCSSSWSPCRKSLLPLNTWCVPCWQLWLNFIATCGLPAPA